MNISKPRDFKHNLHARPDRYSNPGQLMCESNKAKEKRNGKLNISSPTGFQHNLHAVKGSKIGELQVVCCPPQNDDKSDGNGNKEGNADCAQCNELKQQRRKDQIKIKELQEERHSMMAAAARLCVFVTKDLNSNDGGKELLGETNILSEFNESIHMISKAFNELRHDILWSNGTIQVLEEKKRDLKHQVKDLEYQLYYTNKELKDTGKRIRQTEEEFDFRAKKAERELELLRLNIYELQRENKYLHHQLRDSSTHVQRTYQAAPKYSENDLLKKDIEILKKDVMHEVIQLLEPKDSKGPSSEPFERHVSYNIQAKSVKFTEKSNVTYNRDSDSDSLSEIV